MLGRARRSREEAWLRAFLFFADEHEEKKMWGLVREIYVDVHKLSLSLALSLSLSLSLSHFFGQKTQRVKEHTEEWCEQHHHRSWSNCYNVGQLSSSLPPVQPSIADQNMNIKIPWSMFNISFPSFEQLGILLIRLESYSVQCRIQIIEFCYWLGSLIHYYTFLTYS